MHGRQARRGKMDIGCASNQQYLPHMASMLCSLLENNPGHHKIHYLYTNIGTKSLKTLSKFIKIKGSTLYTYQLETAEISHLKLDKHATLENYFRLFIPKVLPDSVKKCLYLDCDTIILDSIEELWDFDIQAYPLAAVEQLGFDRHDELGLSKGSRYFNSGVMLLNLEKFRQEKISEKVIDFIDKYPEKIEYWDQDGLNFVLEGRCLFLPEKWNVYHTFFFDSNLKENYTNIVDKPKIIHFTGSMVCMLRNQ
jgi:lipopolysaccharide biosynthesis glycosyltransferase